MKQINENERKQQQYAEKILARYTSVETAALSLDWLESYQEKIAADPLGSTKEVDGLYRSLMRWVELYDLFQYLFPDHASMGENCTFLAVKESNIGKPDIIYEDEKFPLGDDYFDLYWICTHFEHNGIGNMASLETFIQKLNWFAELEAFPADAAKRTYISHLGDNEKLVITMHGLPKKLHEYLFILTKKYNDALKNEEKRQNKIDAYCPNCCQDVKVRHKGCSCPHCEFGILQIKGEIK